MDCVCFEDTEVLRSGTTQPQLDFLVMPLTLELLPAIERVINSKVAFSRNLGIIHVQIETDGEIAFAAYDQFDEGCVTASSALPVTRFKKLVEERVLHSFTEIQCG